MTSKTEILRDSDPRCAELEALGYTLVGESWGARLRLNDESELENYLEAIARATTIGVILEELTIDHAEAVLQLEATNNPDYPRTSANNRKLPTLHIIEELWKTDNRTYGAFIDGVLVGVLATSLHGELVELDFSSLLKECRGKGIGKALGAVAILAWFNLGVRSFGTGGAMVNEASLGTVRSLGFSIEERWRSYQC